MFRMSSNGIFRKTFVLCVCSFMFYAANYVETKDVKYCKESGCYGDSCVKKPCINGECDEKGSCVCKGCWTGDSCDQQGNKHVPYFMETYQDVKIGFDHSISTPIAVAKAVDEDAENCATKEQCPCAVIKYSLLNDNKNANLFRVDSNTGEIFAKEPLESIKDKTAGGVYLTVGADNEGFDGYGRTGTESTIHISIQKEGNQPYGGFKANFADSGYSEAFPYGYDEDEVHSRAKRAAIDSIAAGTATNVSFHLSKMGMYENTTDMTVGSRIRFQLGIHFPVATTDMLVELFTPDNDTTVMILCDIQVISVGSGLQKDGATVTAQQLTDSIVMEAKTTGSTDYDRGILNLGNVTNSHTGGGLAKSTEMVVIEWVVVMIENNQTQNNTIYWVSAGAEYNNENEIWVGQASFTTNTDIVVLSGIDPTFNYTGPVQVAVGSAAVFRVDMFIPYPSIALSVDVFAPLNTSDVMSVCSVLVVDTGDHYKCLQKEKIPFTLYDASSGKGKSRGRVNMGTVTNAGIHEEDYLSNIDNNRISVEFTMLVYNDSANVGQDFWVGAAVEIGSGQIWAGQMKVSLVDNVTYASLPTPTLALTTKSSTNVSVEESVVYELNITMPMSSEGIYELEVLSPYNDSAARMSICKVELLAQGINVPCFEETSPVFSSRDASNISDRAVWNLGAIKNTGQRSVSTTDPYANTVTFQIIAQVLNHTLNVEGENLWLTVGVSAGTDKLWVGQNAVNIMSQPNTPEAPTFDMRYAFGSDALEIGGAANIEYEIVTKMNSKYTPMNLEFISPYENGSAVMKICRVEIISNGLNLPCFNREKLNSSFVHSSKNDSDVCDKVTVALGAVNNIKQAEDNQTTEDKILFNIIVQMLNHENNVNGSKKWFSTGISYTDKNIWVGQLASFVQSTAKAAYTTGQVPFFDVNRTDTADPNDNVIYHGRTAVHSLTMKLPPYSRADFTISVTADAGINVCVLRVKEVGRNFPCLDEKILGNYTERAGTYYTETGKLFFGPISNIGADVLVQNDTFDNNTVTIEIISSSYDSTVTGTKNLVIEVDYNSGSPYTTTIALDVQAGGALTTSNTSMPSFNFSVSGVNENQTVGNSIAKGQTLLFNLDIYPAAESNNQLMVKFLTPVNQTGVMEVCNVYVVHAGKNIPCLKKQTILPTYETRTIPEVPDHSYVDIGGVDLGHVCHFPIDKIDPEENKVRVQAVAKVTRNNSVAIGDTLWFSSTVRINNDQIYVAQLGLNVVDTFVPTQGNLTDLSNGNQSRIYVNLTTTSMDMYPGQIYDIPIVINVPANISVNGYMDFQMPVNQSAVMTIHHVAVTEAGINLGCMASNYDKEITSTYNSTQGTTQNDHLMFDFGIITNSGISYRSGLYTEADDLLSLTLQVQMADAEVNSDMSEHSINVGLAIGDTLFVINYKVVVRRTGYEKPDILLTATLNESLIYTTSDMITIDAMLKHTNLSSAEGYNVSANFYFPEFLTFVSLTSINLTHQGINDAVLGNGLQFKFAQLFFTDIAAFTFTLRVNESHAVPFINNNLNATTPFGAAGNIIYRPGHVNASETWFVARLDRLSFGVIGPGGVGCDAIPLGMKDGNIQDCQIEGSDSPFAANQPKDGRLGGTSAWTVGTRAGQFTRYMQVYFGNMTKVNQVTLQHSGGATYSRVKSVKMWYGDDGINWEAGELIYTPNAYTTTNLTLSASISSRFIRMEIVSDQTNGKMPSLQAEFSGCVSTSDKPPDQVCSERQTSWENMSPNTLLYKRGFLATSTTNYFCDANPFKDEQVACYSSASGTTVWSALDETVVTIIGHSTSTSELYGIAFDKRSFLSSDDDGQTWMSISQDRYQEVKALPGWTDAKEVKYEVDAVFPMDNSATPYSYATDSLKAKFSGVYRGSTRVTTWGSCC